MIKSKFKLGCALIWLLGFLLIACGTSTEPNELAGPCTETGNPTGIHGKILGPNGRPIIGAKVTLLQQTGSDTAGFAMSISKTNTCLDGSFSFTKIAASTYALEAVDSSTGSLAWYPKAILSDSSKLLNIDLTLASSSQLSGKVTRGKNTIPVGILRNEKILVRIIHTDKSFLTDTSGAFLFPKLGAGIYRLAFTALDGHYLTRYMDSVIIRPGEDMVLPQVDLEWSPFVPPPRPTSPILDSMLDGSIRVHWHPVSVSNFLHYEIERQDSLDPTLTDTLIQLDTIYLDSMQKFSSGHIIQFRIRAVNALGTPSEWSSPSHAPAPEISNPGGDLSILATVTQNGKAAPASTVLLFEISKQNDAPDSLPHPVILLQTISTDSNGQVKFTGLPPGQYGLEAKDSRSLNSAYATLNISKGISPISLKLEPPGKIQGMVSRQGLWVSQLEKMNSYVQVSLLGTPYRFYSGYAIPSGSYEMTGIPPGRYDLVLYAPPDGYFLVDTVKSILVQSGQTLEIPLVKSRYSPDAPPPKPIGLSILSSSNSKLSLIWDGVPNYPFLKGYEVIRMDQNRKILSISGILTEAKWIDDIKGIASGTRLLYEVRVVNTFGKTGIAGGDYGGNPVLFQVP